MKLTRVTSSAGRLTCIRIASSAIGFRSLVSVLRRLEGISALRVHNGWPLTRDDAIEFKFGGQDFVVDTPFDEFCIQPVLVDCPAVTFEQVALHLEQSKPNWLRRIL
jgi:hypothetical protein